MGRSKLRALTALILAAASLAAVVIAHRDRGGAGGPALPGDAREAKVQRVVDGDTVVLSGVGKSRLIGVDTPEVYGRTECFGPEASAYAKRELTGRSVSYTVGREPRDRYGRRLVYVWLADGRSFNAMLLARGFAVPLTIPPNARYAGQFRGLARRARERGTGLWDRRRCFP